MTIQSAGSKPVAAMSTDVSFAFGIVLILSILFLPIPVFLIDFGLAFSLSLSVLILMVSLWITRPLDFSAFPTVLLITTMLRLALNIATTRTILAHGHEGVHAAGHVISGFSQFVMGGDFLIGVVVFSILVIVNFVVITKGSTRIAEVGARFTLDAIPGKQMSIDADLSAGTIDENEAQFRRRELEEESAFFGSMDGASKFVRGDAVAGLIITAVNIVGGILIGVVRHGMSVTEAAEIFMKLSVGDGIVTQMPALIISLAAGLIVSKGGTRGSADSAVLRQLGGYPRALFVAAALLFGLALMPGLPTLPFLAIGGLMALTGQNIQRSRKMAHIETARVAADDKRAEQQVEQDSVRHMLKSSVIELVLGKQLGSKLLSDRQELAFRIGKMRKKFALEYGYVIPEVVVTDDFQIAAKSYLIKLHGTPIASHELRLDEILALIGNGPVPDIPGELVKEPAFGKRALSVPEVFAQDLTRLNFQTVDNISVILTHLSEVVRTNLSQLLSYRDMRTLIDRLEPEYRKLADDTCTSHLTYPGLLTILKSLLSERVSIRNLHLIIEAVAEIAPHMRRAEKIVEHVRMRISQQICGDIADTGILAVMRLGPKWDLAFHESLKKNAKGEIIEFEMDPRLLEKFASEAQEAVSKQSDANKGFALIASQDARPYVRMIVERFAPAQPVLSHVEIARGIELQILGSIS